MPTGDSKEVFQSSPAPKGRCCQHPTLYALGDVGVSILTGPEGPVLRATR